MLHDYIDKHVDEDIKILITYGKHIMKTYKDKDPKVYNRYKMMFFTWMFYLMGQKFTHVTPNI